jgi:hypothetical protein
VVAEVLDAARAHPCRDVGDDPPSQHRDMETLRSIRRDTAEATQRALRERLDASSRRVTGPHGKRAVEVDDEEQGRPRGDEVVEGLGDLAP